MLRICHIISGDLWAGAEVMVFHLLKGLKKYSNLKLSAILLNEGILAEKLRGLGIPVNIFDENKLSFFQLYKEIKKKINSDPPNIIHSHRYKENILSFLCSRNIKSVKLIATQHGLPEPYEGHKKLKNILTSGFNQFILKKYFHKFGVVSKDIEETFIGKYGFLKEKIKVIHNGIEIPKNINLKNDNQFVIGSAGRLFPVKDYPLMVNIAWEVLKQANNIQFKLAGEGPEYLRIRNLIEEFSLNGNFVLEGFMEDLTPFYHKLDIYLNTSLHEGIPISVLEAMSHGIPVIAPRVGGLKEIITDGVDGFLIESRNAKDFAQKCLQLYLDRNLRLKMGQAAREKIVNEFSLENMADQYHRLYEKVFA